MKIKEILLELNVANIEEIKSFIDDVFVKTLDMNSLPKTPPPIASWLNKQLFRWVLNNDKLAVPVTRPWLDQRYANVADDPPGWITSALGRGEEVVRIKFAREYGAYETKLKRQIQLIKAWLIWEYEQDNVESKKLIQKLQKLTVPVAMQLSNKWAKEEEERKLSSTIADEDYKIVMTFKDGYSIIELLSDKCKDLEGDMMQHCLNKNYGVTAFGSNITIYVLKDPNNKSHVTIETTTSSEFNDADEKIWVTTVRQVKGKQNKTPIPKYRPYIKAFTQKFKFAIDNKLKKTYL